jgi:Putative amidoligase enzyme
VAKVRQFIRLYALVEPFFFAEVDKSRQNNIYCVPLSATHLLFRSQVDSINWLTDVWHKYCAFNVKRLADLGTIEFRHFEATEDTAKFQKWLRMIEGLYNFNRDVEVDPIINMRQLTELVFAVTGCAMSQAEVMAMLKDTLINDLLLMVNPTPNLLKNRLKEKKPKPNKAAVKVADDLPF